MRFRGLLVAGFVVSLCALAPASERTPGKAVRTAAAPADTSPQRTARTTTRRLANGRLLTRASATPLNVRGADGRFRPIDTELVRRADGSLEPRAAAIDVRLPSRLTQPVEIADGKHRVGLRLLGAGGRASVKGASATYADALPGVDVRYEALPTGVKEELHVSGAAVPTRYRFALDLSDGLRARQRGTGQIVIADARNRTRLVVAPAFMYDVADRGETVAVPMRLSTTAAGHRIDMLPDARWLRAHARRSTVVIDPTVTETPSVCAVSESSALDCSGYGFVGEHNSEQWKTVVSVTLPQLPPGAQVTEATWRTIRCCTWTDGGAHVYGITEPWDSTWDVARDEEPSDSFVYPSDSVDLTSLVQQWYAGTRANHGVVLEPMEGENLTLGYWVNELNVEYIAPPELKLHGGLIGAVGDRSLSMRALGNGHPVSSLGLWLDPDATPSQSEAAVWVPGGSSAEELSSGYSLPTSVTPGQHTVLVQARTVDNLLVERRWTIHVVEPPTDSSRLGLEQWLHYDETPAGGDSTVLVNGSTGNALWHSVPIVNPGRGLSTVVNLTYNSQDNGGELTDLLGSESIIGAAGGATDLLGLAYREAGIGMSLGISGPTRLNEPLRGVRVAGAAEDVIPLDGLAPVPPEGLKITMVDADGTHHRFTRTGGRWVAPPGLDMHLRRYRSDSASWVGPVPDKWAMTRSDGVTHFFDNHGYLTRTEDRNGNRLEYVYESVDAITGSACAGPIGVLTDGVLCSRRVAEVVDPAGRSLEIEYEPGGFITLGTSGSWISAPFGEIGPLGGRAGRVKRITDHAGRHYDFSYTDGYLTQLVEVAGTTGARKTRFEYADVADGPLSLGQRKLLTAVVDVRDGAEHARTTIDHDDEDAPRVERVVKRSGSEKRYGYPSGGFQVSEQLQRSPERLAVTNATIDGRGRATTVTDPIGRVTGLSWNDQQNKISVLRAAQSTTDESVTTFSYDDTNRTGVLESQTTYPNYPSTQGARTTDLVWSFGRGQHVGVGDTAGTFVADIDRIENPKPGTGFDFTTDARGNVTHRTDAAGKVAVTTYDQFGRITSELDESSVPMTYSNFHETGQPQDVTNGREDTWTYRYDAVGNTVAVIDPRATDRSGIEGRPYTTTLQYDGFDRLVREHVAKVTNPNWDVHSLETRFVTRTREYDRNGNMTKSTDGAGVATRATYSFTDQLLSVIRPGTEHGDETTTYVYDDAERLVARIGAKGDPGIAGTVRSEHAGACAAMYGSPPARAFVTRYCLDDAGQLRAEVRTSTVAGDPTALISSYAYDRRGNLVGEVDPNRNATRSVGEALAAADAPGTRRMTYSYNKVDERVAALQQPTEGNLPSALTEFGYDDNGNRTFVRHPRGPSVRTEYRYDHRDQLIAVEDPLDRMRCTERRANGQVIGETTARGTAVAHARCLDGDPQTTYRYFSTRYTYDAAGDLHTRSIPFAPDQYGRSDAALEDWKVTYHRDALGRPTTITDARDNSFDNTFFDTGELRTTERPSWWAIRWGGGHEDPLSGQRYAAGTAPADYDISEGGPAVVERMGRSANAAMSDRRRVPSPTLGQTDFGRVDREPLANLLPQAGVTRLVYDAEMRLRKVHDARGRDKHVRYFDDGRVKEKTWPFDASREIVHSYQYDKHGNLTRYKDGDVGPGPSPVANAITYAYDGYDRRTGRDAAGAHDTDLDDVRTQQSRWTYDRNGNLLTYQTPRGTASPSPGDFTYHYGYDSLDRLASEQAPDTATWTYGYDVSDNVVLETSPLGQGLSGSELELYQRTSEYDDADQLIEMRTKVRSGADIDELVTNLDHDLDGNVTQRQEPGAAFAPGQGDVRQLSKTVYDGRGLPWKVSEGRDEIERTRWLEYDPNGNLRRVVDPRGVELDDVAVDTGGDGADNLRDASKHATVNVYDAHDLLVQRHLPWNGGDTRRFRQEFIRNDGLRRVTTLLAPHDVSDNSVPATSYTYFDTDWVESISDQKLVNPDTQVRVESKLVTFDYDKRGLQKLWRSKNAGDDHNGRHITRTFWPSGALRTRTAKKVDDPDAAASRRRYEYLYDLDGGLVRMVDENKSRSTVIDRDSLGRQLSVDEVWAGGRDTTYAYDIAGNVKTRRTDGVLSGSSYTGDDAKTTTFDYDSLDREIRMEVNPPSGGNRVTTTRYWPSGSRRSREKPNGTTERWFFTTRGERSRSQRFDAGDDPGTDDPERETIYTYDKNGNRKDDERGHHEYNARSQLVEWGKPNSSQVTRYQLNPDGAVRFKRVFSSPTDETADEVTEYSYLGERLRWAETEDVRSVYRYDDFGNVVRIVSRARQPNGEFPPPEDTPIEPDECDEIPANSQDYEIAYYCYDEFERLIFSVGAGVEDPELIEYDGLDRRDSRRVETSSGTRTRDFSYVGTTEQLSREVEPGGDRRFYDYDAAGDRQGQTVSKPNGTTTYRGYTKDANGSVLALENGDGEIINNSEYVYDPYGELDSSVTLGEEAQDNPFRFDGFYYDSGVKTYDMHARHYRPDVGRFLTQDHYASASADLLLQSDPLTQNRYAFAGANPVTYTEFDGHKPTDCKYCDATGNVPKDKQDDEAKHQQRVIEVNQRGWDNWLNSAEYNQQASPEGRRALAQEKAYETSTIPAPKRKLPPPLIVPEGPDVPHDSPDSAGEALENLWVGLSEAAKNDLEMIQEAGGTTIEYTMHGCFLDRSREGCPSKAESNQAAETLAGVYGRRGGGGRTSGILSKPTVSDPKLQNKVDNLYKGTMHPNPVGSGTTADAVRHELATGQKVGNKFHIQKAQDEVRGLRNWLADNPSGNPHDRLVAQSLHDELVEVLGPLAP